MQTIVFVQNTSNNSKKLGMYDSSIKCFRVISIQLWNMEGLEGIWLCTLRHCHDMDALAEKKGIFTEKQPLKV